MRLAIAVSFLLLWSTASSFGTPAKNQSDRSSWRATTRLSHSSLLGFTSSRPFASFGLRGGGTPSTLTSALHLSSSSTSSDRLTDENLALLSPRGRNALERLVEYDTDGAQQHVYGHWPPPGLHDSDKQRLAEQVRKSNI
jgi:hypothetical protein